jgi:Ca2+-binding EF-hand superfamily protein
VPDDRETAGPAASGVTMQQEKTMRKTTKLAFAFIALAGAVGSAAYAENVDSAKMRERTMMRLDRAVNDNGGAITFDQFSDAMDARLKKLVADNGGKLTVAQLADALEKARFERMARRIIARYDTRGDGTLTSDDITGREKKVFAMLDKNNDGKIEKSELPKGNHHSQLDEDNDGGVQ